ncbi:MAG: AmmeMemoRadiSam system protein A [Geobacter sp.]|nr:AmmeMemoRadiSam system protein A [Geobacter sp.]
MKNRLSEEERTTLLDIARETIVTYVKESSMPEKQLSNERLHAKQGCFVTIKKDGRLRGCIGNFVSDKPLYKLTQEMAVSAAVRDPRFYPMKASDLDEFSLEISVLSPLSKIENIDEIEVGTHGLYIEKNFARGVLLPQVATEYGWDRETFLSQTSVKAGLEQDDWRDGADIYIFDAQVFGD